MRAVGFKKQAAAHLLTTALLALVCSTAQARVSIEPPLPLLTLEQDNPQAVYDNTTLLAALGASQVGIKTALLQNLFLMAEGVPPQLLKEPALSLLADAVYLYYMMYPAVDSVVYSAAMREGQEAARKLVGNTSLPVTAGNPNEWWHTQSTVAPGGGGQDIANKAVYYSQLWYDLDIAGGPLVLTWPKMKDPGYWLCPFFDVYGEQFGTVGTRLGHNTGVQILLVPQGYNHSGGAHGFPPERIFTSPTPQGFLLGRVLWTSPDAVEFEMAWNLTLLDGTPPPQPSDFGYNYTDAELALQVVNASDPFYFWNAAGEALQRNPKPGMQDPLSSSLPLLGLSLENGFDQGALSDTAELALVHAAPIAARLMEARYNFLGTKDTNFWALPTLMGRTGGDYQFGAAICKYWWVGNWLEDAAYYYQYLDSDGMPLQGSETYTVSFNASSLPPNNPKAFWSFQVLNLSLITYPNPDNLMAYAWGYNVGKTITSTDTNVNITDAGEFSFQVSPKPPPDGVDGSSGDNWLPNVDGFPVQLVLRVYWPDMDALPNYVPPPVVRQKKRG